ncbi:MAG: PIN domain-containing protein [Armatimonadetes bacterium]|nr:PIN domain-containing protein [Armatimonadota bacterium]
MRVLLDTSALVAMIDTHDPAHEATRDTWASMLGDSSSLVLTSLMLVETLAVLPRRMGMEVVTAFCQRQLPLVEVYAVETPLLLTAVDTWGAARRRDLSLVDVVSFLVMRREGLSHAFTLDPHFAEQGFECLPA